MSEHYDGETVEDAELDGKIAAFLSKLQDNNDRLNQVADILMQDPLQLKQRVAALGELEKMQLGSTIDLAQMVLNAVPQRNRRVAKQILRDAITLIDYQIEPTDTIKEEAQKVMYGYDAVLQQTYEREI